MAQVPVWAIGRHVTVCSITPQTVASDGTLSDGSTSSLVGSIDSIEFSVNAELEEISAMTTTRQNHVLIKDGAQVTLTEILKYNGTNLLPAFIVAANIGKFIVTRGAQTWTFYGIRSDYNESLQRGKSVATLTLMMVDPNTGNPAYA